MPTRMGSASGPRVFMEVLGVPRSDSNVDSIQYSRLSVLPVTHLRPGPSRRQRPGEFLEVREPRPEGGGRVGAGAPG